MDHQRISAAEQTSSVEPRAFADLVLDLIESFGCTPTPKAYEVFFAYAAKNPPKVRLHIDAASEPDHVLSSFDLDRIHTELFRTPEGDRTAKESSAEAIEVTLNEVFELISTHIERTQAGQGRLETTAKAIDPGMNAAELQRIAADLAAETAATVQSGSALTSSLKERRAKLTDVRSDLAVAQRDAHADELTGLPGPRGYDAAVRSEWGRARAEGTLLALCLIDLDKFSQVNERFDPKTGDAVLRAIGRSLPTQTSEREIICRHGGQEFAILMPGRNATDAFRLAQDLRAWLERRRFYFRESGVDVGNLTASFGLSVLQGNTSAEQMVANASAMLVKAKDRGGNRVVSDTPPMI